MTKIKIIAEAGVNHNGSLKLALKLVDAAKAAGADFVKFQIYSIDNLVLKNSKKAQYQSLNYNKEISQYKMLKKFFLTYDQHYKIYKYCIKKKIKYLASGFSIQDYKFINKLKCEYIKIPSGEITNYPLLKFIGKLKKKIILSTGASMLSEVNYALSILINYGTLKKNIVLMQCTSNYPANLEEINLNVLQTFQEKFNTLVGFSDHTKEIFTSAFAIIKGAVIIEKHLTLNNNLKGPDHNASLNPRKFAEMVKLVKLANLSLGSYKKDLSFNEKKNLKFIRKGIYASKNIQKGQRFDDKNIILLRPEHKLNASKWYKLIGKKSKKNFTKNQKIQ